MTARASAARPLILAHRGDSSRAPENTLAAIRAAARSRAGGVEFDVRLTSDGVPVVFHDDRLERTTDGRGLLADRPAREVARLDAGAWFGPGFRGEGVPTLAEALEACGRRFRVVNVELKGGAVRGHRIEDAAAAVVRRSAAAVRGRVVLSSFDLSHLRRLARVAPAIPRAWIVRSVPFWFERRAASLGVGGLHPACDAVTPRFVRRVRAAGLWLWAWTADGGGRIRRLARLGVDGIHTNDPAAARRALRGV